MRVRASIWFVFGLVGATALLWTAVAFGQIDSFVGRLRPVVVDIDQEVPVLADVPIQTDDGVVTTTIPMTLNLALRVSLSSALTPVITVKETMPEVTVIEPDKKLVDDLGIAYTFEIDSPDLTVTEWTVFFDTRDYFHIAGEVYLVPAAEPVTEVQVLVRFYNSDGGIIEVEDIGDVGYNLNPGSSNRIEALVNINPKFIDHYTVEFEVLR